MVLVVLGLFLVLVAGLAWLSAGSTRTHGCCAPADPSQDLRMRSAREDPPATKNAASDC